MKRIYVAGAYSAPDVIGVFGNMRRGIKMSVDVLKAGFAPFCPWADHIFSFVEEIDLNTYYQYSLSWLEVCNAMVVVPENALMSKGTQAEIKRAVELGIPVYYSLEDLIKNESV